MLNCEGQTYEMIRSPNQPDPAQVQLVKDPAVLEDNRFRTEDSRKKLKSWTCWILCLWCHIQSCRANGQPRMTPKTSVKHAPAVRHCGTVFSIRTVANLMRMWHKLRHGNEINLNRHSWLPLFTIPNTQAEASGNKCHCEFSEMLRIQFLQAQRYVKRDFWIPKNCAQTTKLQNSPFHTFSMLTHVYALRGRKGHQHDQIWNNSSSFSLLTMAPRQSELSLSLSCWDTESMSDQSFE